MLSTPDVPDPYRVPVRLGGSRSRGEVEFICEHDEMKQEGIVRMGTCQGSQQV